MSSRRIPSSERVRIQDRREERPDIVEKVAQKVAGFHQPVARVDGERE